MAGITQRLMEYKYDLHENHEDDEVDEDVAKRDKCRRQRNFKLFKALTGELLGVCIYVFIGCMATPHPKGFDPALKHPGVGAVPIALSQGLALVFLTMTFLKISGAHLNPAVSLAVVLCGELSPGVGLAYCTTQIVGGIVGAALCRAVLSEEIYIGINGGAHELHVGPGSGIACETILTCVVVLTYILAILDRKTRSERGSIAIGFSVIVTTLAGASSTGGCMNPVRCFGPAVAFSVYSKDVWKHHYVYWVGAVCGAFIAVLLYRLIFASPEKLLFRHKSKSYQKIPKSAPVEEMKSPTEN